VKASSRAAFAFAIAVSLTALASAIASLSISLFVAIFPKFYFVGKVRLFKKRNRIHLIDTT
jgi:hypothetical protein